MISSAIRDAPSSVRTMSRKSRRRAPEVAESPARSRIHFANAQCWNPPGTRRAAPRSSRVLNCVAARCADARAAALFVQHRACSRVRSSSAPRRADSSRARERLDQVVVGAGVEAFDARFLAGARRQQDHRNVAQRRVAAQRRIRPKPSSRGIITSETMTSGRSRARRVERRLRRRPRFPPVVRRQQARDVVAHVGVVVGEQHARAERALRNAGRAGRLRASGGAFGSRSQRSASCT